DNPGVGRHGFEQGGIEHRAVAVAAAEQSATSGDRLVDPGFEPHCFVEMDHWADERVALLGVARYQGLCPGDQHVAETLVDLGMDNDALHSDTALPRLVEGAENDAF